jgi:hypothetical protein
VPRRRPWGKPHPPEDPAYNIVLSHRRVVVENSILGLCQYQVLTQTDRNHRRPHTTQVVALAGLVNRQIRHYLPR